jgi:hypothetical protein
MARAVTPEQEAKRQEAIRSQESHKVLSVRLGVPAGTIAYWRWNERRLREKEARNLLYRKIGRPDELNR